jgi:choline kinase
MAASDAFAKGSISEFLLDSRTPGGSAMNMVEYNYAEDEARREQDTDQQVEALLTEVKIWRVANSAQWVAWGIVQAKVPALDGNSTEGAKMDGPPTNGNVGPVAELDNRPEGVMAEALLHGDTVKEAEQLEEAEDQFDYIGYAQERARFFWGDVVSLGFVKKEELPAELAENLKIVEY